MSEMKFTRRSAMALGAAAATSAIVRPSFAQTPATVKIATVVPLSGPWATTGKNIKDGADFAVEDINASGGIKALGGAKLQLIAADAEDSVEKAKNAAQRLLAQEPDLIGGLGDALSGMTLAVTELTEKAEMPWITQTFADALTERGFKYLFEAVPVASAQGELAIPAVIEMAKAATGKAPKTVAVVADSNQAIQVMVQTWRNGGYKAAGLEVISEKTYSPPIADATELVSNLRRNKPDMLFVMPSGLPDLKLLLDKLTELGLGRDVLPTFAVSGPSGLTELLNVAGAQALENFTGIHANWPGKKHEQLVERFKAKTGLPWMTTQSLCGYGQVMVYRDALEKAGAADRRKVAAAIRAMDTTEGAANFFPGRLKWDERGRLVGAGLVLAQWRGGKPVAVYPAEIASAKPVWVGKL